MFVFEYYKWNELDEYESIFDEVHEEFLRKVYNICELFERVRHRLESILRRHSHDFVLVWSIFFFGEDTFGHARDAYPRTTRDFAWVMYPRGLVELYFVAVCAFVIVGFK